MILSICNEKGGSGKSTLALNLAINKAQNSKVILVDCDPQKSLATFMEIRESENHPRLFDFTFLYGDKLKTFLENSHDKDIIIDTGGRDSKEMRIAMLYCDIVLIPTIPSQFDVSVLEKMVAITKDAKKVNPKLKAFIVINRASTNPFLSKKIQILKEYIKELENDYIKLTDTILFEREIYKISAEFGLGVSEMKQNKATQEIDNLLREIK